MGLLIGALVIKLAGWVLVILGRYLILTVPILLFLLPPSPPSVAPLAGAGPDPRESPRRRRHPPAGAPWLLWVPFFVAAHVCMYVLLFITTLR